MADPEAHGNVTQIDWEAFYANYRKPDYVPGYEILQKLGAGAFGIVFKARKHSIGKDYAIKFLKVDDAAVRDAVLHELDTVRLFAQIDHPNLVSIEDMGHVSGIPYIVMGYAGEETLARRLQEGPRAGGALPRDVALAIFVQVCRGVHALHDRMLVHFDLKPANVYLKGDTARVGDYGLSKLVTASRRSLSFGRGTTYYMAPEVLHRKGDHRSDIYSLGVVLYECLVGRVPFQGETEWEILKKHESESPAYPATLSTTDRAILQACLAKAPDDRVQSIPDLLAMLHGTMAPPRKKLPPSSHTAHPAPATVASAASPTPARGFRTLRVLAISAAVFLGAAFLLRAIRTAKDAPPPPSYARAFTPTVPSRPTDGARQKAPVSRESELAPDAAMPARSGDEARQVAEFQTRVDDVIAALQRLREVDVRLSDVRSKALSALGATARSLDRSQFRGHDPWMEALLQTIRAALENEDVRERWTDVFRSLVGTEAKEPTAPSAGSPDRQRRH